MYYMPVYQQPAPAPAPVQSGYGVAQLAPAAAAQIAAQPQQFVQQPVPAVQPTMAQVPVAAPPPVSPQPVVGYPANSPQPQAQPMPMPAQPVQGPQPLAFGQAVQQVAQQAPAQPQFTPLPMPQPAPTQLPGQPAQPQIGAQIAAAAQQAAFQGLVNQITSQAAQALPGVQQAQPAPSYAMPVAAGHVAAGGPPPGQGQPMDDYARIAGLGTTTQVQGLLPTQQNFAAQPQTAVNQWSPQQMLQPAQPQPALPPGVQAQGPATLNTDQVHNFVNNSSDAEFSQHLGTLLHSIGEGMKTEGLMT